VLYVKPNQLNISEIFENNPPKDTRFWTFMSQIDTQITLNNWTRYRGDFGTSGTDILNPSYWTEWRNFEIMFHIAPLLDSEQHRRLIGNDIAVIIFFDNSFRIGESITLFDANGIGIVPQVFAVVEPDINNIDNYRLAFFNGSNLGNYKPQSPPSNYFFHFEDIRDFLFTKIYNGYAVAMSVPPMNRFYTLPRKEAIKELGQKYKPVNEKEEKKRFAQESKKFKRLPTESHDPLLKIALIAGRGLIPKENNQYSNPFCELKLNQQTSRSFHLKKTLNPKWHSEFIFRLSGVHGHEDLQLVCMNAGQDVKMIIWANYPFY